MEIWGSWGARPLSAPPPSAPARKETILRVVGGVVVADFAARAHEVDTSAAAVGVGGGAARVVVHAWLEGSVRQCRGTSTLLQPPGFAAVGPGGGCIKKA